MYAAPTDIVAFHADLDASLEAVAIVTQAYTATIAGKPIAAAETIAEFIDRALLDGRPDRARAILWHLDPGQVAPEATLGALLFTSSAGALVEPERTQFLDRARVALAAIWDWERARIDRLIARDAADRARGLPSRSLECASF